MDAAPGSLEKWKPYPVYKDSEIEWLGDVPEHWEVTPMKYIAIFINGAPFKPEDWIDEGIPIIRIENLNGGDQFNYTTLQVSSKFHVKYGDLLFAWSGNRGTSFGPYLWEKKGIYYLNQHIFRLEGYKLDKKFFYWVLKGVTAYVEKQAHGIIGLVHITKEELGIIGMPLIPDPEQHVIAAFLDREIARIDAIILKKEQLIKLLQEKRAALISHAVTKGLDPSVPMKDSGVEWLGKVPEHWGVKRLKFCFEFLNSKRVPISSEERGKMAKEYPYYGASGIIDYVENYIFDETLILVAEDGANLFSRSTPLAFLASGKYWVNNHAHILRPIVGPIEYLSHLLAIIVYDPWITGSAQPKLTKENLGSIYLPMPPKDEREHLNEYLNTETMRFDMLIIKILAAIEKLKEYRTALISAAVTGKIDVRDEVCLGGTA